MLKKKRLIMKLKDGQEFKSSLVNLPQSFAVPETMKIDTSTGITIYYRVYSSYDRIGTGNFLYQDHFNISVSPELQTYENGVYNSNLTEDEITSLGKQLTTGHRGADVISPMLVMDSKGLHADSPTKGVIFPRMTKFDAN